MLSKIHALDNNLIRFNTLTWNFMQIIEKQGMCVLFRPARYSSRASKCLRKSGQEGEKFFGHLENKIITQEMWQVIV